MHSNQRRYRTYFKILCKVNNNTIKNSLQDLQELEIELEANFLIFFPELEKMAFDFLAEHNL